MESARRRFMDDHRNSRLSDVNRLLAPHSEVADPRRRMVLTVVDAGVAGVHGVVGAVVAAVGRGANVHPRPVPNVAWWRSDPEQAARLLVRHAMDAQAVAVVGPLVQRRRRRRRSRSRSRSRDARRRPRDGGQGASAPGSPPRPHRAEPSRSASWDAQAELDSLHNPPVGSDDGSTTSAEDDVFEMYPQEAGPAAVVSGSADDGTERTNAQLVVHDPELAELLRSPVPSSGDGECEGGSERRSGPLASGSVGSESVCYPGVYRSLYIDIAPEVYV